MGDNEVQSGDFLSDVEIVVLVRSGQTDHRELQKLIQSLTTSVTSLVDTKIVLTEIKETLTKTPGKTLSVCSRSFYID